MPGREASSLYGGARELHELLLELRAARSLPSLRKIAEAAGTSPGYVSDILQGKRTPGPDLAERVAAALGAGPDRQRAARRHAERAELDPKPADPAPPKPYHLQELRPAGSPAEESLSALLEAHRAVVDFYGRSEELGRLAAWRDDNSSMVAVTLVVGAGGEGKTRLAHRFCAGSDGWATVEARHTVDLRPIARRASSRRAAASRGLIILVDYAERWPSAHLLLLIDDMLTGTTVPVRVILLARSARIWWDVLRKHLRQRSVSADMLRIPRLGISVEERKAIYALAVAQFAAVLGAEPETRPELPAALVRDENAGQALTLHMAALVAADAAMRGVRGPTDPASFSAYLLDRELDYWRQMHDKPAEPMVTSPATMARAVFLAALTGPHDWFDATAALNRVGLGGASPDQVLDDHFACYPAEDGMSVLNPLYPDRLAEDFIALQIPGSPAATTPDPWTTPAVQRLLPTAEDPRPDYFPKFMAVLTACAQRWPHIAHGLLYPLVTARPGLMMTAGSPALIAISELPDLPTTALQALQDAFPNDWQSDAAEGIAAIAQRYTDRVVPHTDLDTQAYLYVRLASWLREAGLHERALAESEKAVRIRRTITGVPRERNDPALAAALRGMAVSFATFDRHDEALRAVREALDLWKAMPRTDAEGYDHHVALGYDNLSVQLGASGRTEESIQAARSAVEIYSRLAPRRAYFTKCLALALHHLSARLNESGLATEAITPGQQSVSIYRELVGTMPSAVPELATALNSMGNVMADAGNPEAAIDLAVEAVALARELALTNPAGQLPLLGVNLYNLAHHLAEGGRPQKEVSQVAEEALLVCRKLVAADPTAFSKTLVNMLFGLSGIARRSGNVAEATELAQEAEHGPAARYLKRTHTG
ncbi:tetratricopeptide repeat protein [Actinoplanes sp. HUAS TT8]|uniref:tetratricopeptide repeat protein n=1 Tax=Actinoplanes sp. HUAS TT8 TaxID=3447453 RepID=UPI003F51C186